MPRNPVLQLRAARLRSALWRCGREVETVNAFGNPPLGRDACVVCFCLHRGLISGEISPFRFQRVANALPDHPNKKFSKSYREFPAPGVLGDKHGKN